MKQAIATILLAILFSSGVWLGGWANDRQNFSEPEPYAAIYDPAKPMITPKEVQTAIIVRGGSVGSDGIDGLFADCNSVQGWKWVLFNQYADEHWPKGE